MKTVRNRNDLRRWIRSFRESRSGVSLGFVPTMGYLHKGHLSLIRTGVSENDALVVSIFVNPIQFGPAEDYERYPRDEERDMELCRKAGTDLLFIPPVSEMYPPGHLTRVSVGALTEPLCGAHRPGHFDGVTTVVAKLFNMVTPDRAYFGQKDGQQALVIRKMTRDLDFPTDIRILPTVREPDGLAMSSRNVFLSAEGRKSAPRIYEALRQARQIFDGGERRSDRLLESARTILQKDPRITIQYLECRFVEDLRPAINITGPVMIAIAAYIDAVRLIDNITLGEESIS